MAVQVLEVETGMMQVRMGMVGRQDPAVCRVSRMMGHRNRLRLGQSSTFPERPEEQDKGKGKDKGGAGAKIPTDPHRPCRPPIPPLNRDCPVERIRQRKIRPRVGIGVIGSVRSDRPGRAIRPIRIGGMRSCKVQRARVRVRVRVRALVLVRLELRISRLRIDPLRSVRFLLRDHPDRVGLVLLRLLDMLLTLVSRGSSIRTDTQRARAWARSTMMTTTSTGTRTAMQMKRLARRGITLRHRRPRVRWLWRWPVAPRVNNA